MAVSGQSLSRETIAAIRFGYGLRPGEEGLPGTAEQLIAQLSRAVKAKPRFPRDGLTARRETATRILSLRNAEAKAAKDGNPNETIRKQTQREAQRIYREDAMARIAQAVQSPYGFHERLASFWVDHFSTSAIKAFPMRMIVALYEAEAIRPNLAGKFSDLLRAAILHPAMLIYLDQNQSVAPDSMAGRQKGRGLNENLGRELLELHTLGAGSGYTQDDVRAAALILTGLAVDGKAMQVTFMPRRSEIGPVTLLGREYEDEDNSGQDHLVMLNDLAGDPRTARHIATKLAAHFIDDDPPDEVVAAMTDAWQASGGNLTEVYRAMLMHPRAWEQPGTKIKQPFEFIVSSLRALDVTDRNVTDLLADIDNDKDDGSPVGKAVGKAIAMAGSDPAGEVRKQRAGRATALTIGALKTMGQPVWEPPSPAGFPDRVDAWLTPSQLSERIAWARLAARTLGQTLEPSDFLKTALADAASPETIEVIRRAPNRIHGITMVLASAEFNRR